MPRWQRLQLTACAGAIAFLLAYVVTDYAAIPRFFYDPLERQWRLATGVKGLPMGYAGLWLYAIGAAVIAGGAVWLGLRWRARPVGERALGLAVAWTATAAVLAIGYYAWHNWP